VNNTDTNMRVARIFDEAAALVREKNPRYGSSWRHQGWRGNLSRILEKAGRLRSMLWRRDPELLNASNEHPRQTMLDMMNTLAFAIINMDDGLEYGHEQEPPRQAAAPAQPIASANGWVTDGSGNMTPAGTWPMPPELEGSNEVTATNLPTPGEEHAEGHGFRSEPDKPSPQPRVAVQDKGSGPRKRPIKNAPQA
jgi:hypothetical protein